MKKLNRHFGKITALPLLFIILASNATGANLSDHKFHLNFSTDLFYFAVVLFFIMLYFFYKKLPILFGIVFWFLLFNTQALFISKFLKSVELENINSSIRDVVLINVRISTKRFLKIQDRKRRHSRALSRLSNEVFLKMSKLKTDSY